MCISSFLCVHSMKNVFLIFVLLTVLMWSCSLGLTKIVKCLYFSPVVSFLLFKSRSPSTLPSGSLSKVYWMLGRRLNVINLLRHLTDAFSKFYARPKSTRFSMPVTLCQCLFIYVVSNGSNLSKTQRIVLCVSDFSPLNSENEAGV